MIMNKMNNNLNKLLITRGILESNQKKYYHNGHKIKICNISHNNLMCNHKLIKVGQQIIKTVKFKRQILFNCHFINTKLKYPLQK